MELTWPKVLTWGFTLIGASITATWLVRVDRVEDLRDRLAACERASELGYPVLLQSLNEASQSLSGRLNKLEAVDTLKADRDSLSEQLDQLKSRMKAGEEEMATKLEALQEDLERLRARLAEIYSHDLKFDLMPGEAKDLAGGKIVVGFSEATVDRTCRVTINNQDYEWKTGSYVETVWGKNACKTILSRCEFGSNHSAKFQFICAGRQGMSVDGKH